ncbi:MAG: type IV pilus assembly protein PilM [PVC group bacterium]|nr:type IV pilus assembly protein PilM [PVC group bacterium]
MSDKNKTNQEHLDKVVRSRIKGLGLDALFHQVDKSKKDENHPPVTTPDFLFSEGKTLAGHLKKGLSLNQIKTLPSSLYGYCCQAISQEAPYNLIIDFGSRNLKILEIKKEKENFILTNVVCISIPYLVSNTTEEKMFAFIHESIHQNISSDILEKAHLTTLIPRSKVVIKLIDLPTQNDNEIDKMIEFEAERHLPFPLSDIEIDYQILAKKESRTQVIVAAIKKEDIAKHLRLLKTVNLHPHSIAVSALSLYNSIVNSLPFEGVHMQLNIGAEYCDMNIIKDKQLILSRGIHWGSENLTLDLSRKFNIEFENAEKIKKDNGIVLTKKQNTKTKKTISDITKAWADKLLNEIKRTTESMQLEHGITTLDQIILSGGGSRIINLNDYLRDSLKTKITNQKMPVEIQALPQIAKHEQCFPEFATSLGIIIPESENFNPLKLNLLPRKIKQELTHKKRKTQISVLAGIITGITAISLLVPTMFVGYRESIIKNLDVKIAELKPALDSAQKLRDKIQSIEGYISVKNSCMEVVREISILVPYDITLDSFAFERNNSSVCTGIAQAHSSVVKFSQRLNESSFFENAKIIYTKKKDIPGKEIVDFEIICELNKLEAK